MLWYQLGLRADPPDDATTSQLPGPSGKRASAVCRFSPVLAPIVVRYSRSIPMNLSPRRRCHLIIVRPTNRVNAFDRDGTRAPRVPLGIFSKLMMGGSLFETAIPAARRDLAMSRRLR